MIVNFLLMFLPCLMMLMSVPFFFAEFTSHDFAKIELVSEVLRVLQPTSWSNPDKTWGKTMEIGVCNIHVCLKNTACFETVLRRYD